MNCLGVVVPSRSLQAAAGTVQTTAVTTVITAKSLVPTRETPTLVLPMETDLPIKPDCHLRGLSEH